MPRAQHQNSQISSTGQQPGKHITHHHVLIRHLVIGNPMAGKLIGKTRHRLVEERAIFPRFFRPSRTQRLGEANVHPVVEQRHAPHFATQTLNGVTESLNLHCCTTSLRVVRIREGVTESLSDCQDTKKCFGKWRARTSRERKPDASRISSRLNIFPCRIERSRKSELRVRNKRVPSRNSEDSPGRAAAPAANPKMQYKRGSKCIEMNELYVLLGSCTVHLKGIHVKWQLTSKYILE